MRNHPVFYKVQEEHATISSTYIGFDMHEWELM